MSYLSLSTELWHFILNKLNTISLFTLLKVSRVLSNMVSNTEKWKRLHFLLATESDNNTRMLLAAKEGELDLVKLYRKRGGNFLFKGVLCATIGGYIDIVQFFIDEGLDKEYYLGEEGTFVVDSVCKWRIKDEMIGYEFKVDRHTGIWYWPAFLAVMNKHLDLLKFYINKNAFQWVDDGIRATEENLLYIEYIVNTCYPDDRSTSTADDIYFWSFISKTIALSCIYNGVDEEYKTEIVRRYFDKNDIC